MSGYPDVSPSSGSKSKGGLKNDDGRIDGKKYDKQQKAKFSPKETYSPNDDVRKLPQRPGLEEGAY